MARLVGRATAARDPGLAGVRLIALYEDFDEQPRALADIVAAECVASSEVGAQWAGRLLVGEFRVTRALAAVRASAATLAATLAHRVLFCRGPSRFY